MKKTKKVRKIGQNEASQEEKYNDKSTIHLPRQSVVEVVENRYLQWCQPSEQMNFPLTVVGGSFSIILGMVVLGYNTVREMIWILVKYNLLKYS